MGCRSVLCVTKYLNNLNRSLQGKGTLVVDMRDKICSFIEKLHLFERQLGVGNLTYFECPASLSLAAGISLSNYQNKIRKLSQSFQTKFQDLKILDKELNLFATPFAVSADEVPAAMQLELLDLQNATLLKDRYNNTLDLLRWYRLLHSESFPMLHRNAAKHLSMFGSTYCCEQLFSVMKRVKSKNRAQMNDCTLTSVLRIASANAMIPDISKLIKKEHVS